MNALFLLLEFSCFIFAGYIFLTKQELSIIYLPVLFFTQTVITPVLPASLNYLVITLLIGYFIYRNPGFFKFNVFAILLIVLVLALMSKTTDFVNTRPFIIGVVWLFLLIPLLTAIYRKYPGKILFRELSTASTIILWVFIVNVVFSSIYGYAPHAMYGITSGILYGNLYATDFNILPIALFIVLMKVISSKKPLHFITFLVSLSFILLSLRRSVMGLSILALLIVLLIFLTPKNFKTILGFSLALALLGTFIALKTNFTNLLLERYELRKLDERELEEEKRFLEYELLYKDIFIHQDYSPWFGYKLFESGGNYGKGILGGRTLHADLTNIVHSVGFVGLALYLLMFFTVFYLASSRARSKTDILIVVFCALIFMVYTITGRYTNISCFTLMTALLMLPTGIKSILKPHPAKIKHYWPLKNRKVTPHELV